MSALSVIEELHRRAVERDTGTIPAIGDNPGRGSAWGAWGASRIGFVKWEEHATKKSTHRSTLRVCGVR